ncbi:MAG: DUF433 domain-containing protein [Planctomycetia bacterium]|nr:DUF433 domain-containing protein [Planctomycetia bacterium]
MALPTERAEAIPLEADDSGTLRLVGSRVTLDVVAAAWRGGATPEQIVDQYPGLKLADVYAVVTWILRHPAELASYVASREAAAGHTRQQVEQACPADGLRGQLLARPQPTDRA